MSEPSSPYFFAWNITHRTKHLGHDLNVLFKYCTQNLNGLRDIQSEVKTCGTWKKKYYSTTDQPTELSWVMRVSILSWMPEQKQIKKNKISRYRIRKKLSQQLISCRTDVKIFQSFFLRFYHVDVCSSDDKHMEFCI